MKIAYFITLENFILSPLIKSQVFELMQDMKKKYGEKVEIDIISLFPLHNIFRYKKDIRDLQKSMQFNGINLLVFPTLLITKFFYMKLPFLLFYLITGLPFLLIYYLKHRPDIFHCRSYLTSALIHLLKIIFKTKIIFDMRGLYPEEGIVHKQWSENSLNYKMWKWIERYLIKKSEKSVVVSDTFLNYIVDNFDSKQVLLIYPYTKFKMNKKGIYKKNKSFKFVFTGSFYGSWYQTSDLFDLINKIILYFENLNIETKFVIVTLQPDLFIQKIKNSNINLKYLTVISATTQEVYKYLLESDVGIVILKKINNESEEILCNTMIGVKVIEYIAAGLPVLINENFRGAGYLIDKFKIGKTYKYDLTDIDNALNLLVKNYNLYANNVVDFYSRSLKKQNILNAYSELYKELDDE